MKDQDTVILEQLYVEMSSAPDGNQVWSGGEYYITVSSKKYPEYFKLFEHKRGSPVNPSVGRLSLSAGLQKNGGEYYKISYVHIKPSHRGQGLGYILYKVALENLPEGVLGLASYLPERANGKQILKIYKRLGGYEEGDWAFIDKP